MLVLLALALCFTYLRKILSLILGDGAAVPSVFVFALLIKYNLRKSHTECLGGAMDRAVE